MMTDYNVFPYAAIVGQDDFKLALELSLVDRTLGGVLVSGDKGTGKTTTVRSLSALLREGNDFPFVNLPVGASEDRVLGSVDIEKLINEKRQVLQRGLLAQAHGGILYIDEVNLLPDYLTDILLDAAATGGYHLEREGLSAWQPSRFSLVGTMNPEEGALRPQLLDRFGLGVDVKTPRNRDERASIAKRRIAFDTDPGTFIAGYARRQDDIRERLLQAMANLATVSLPEPCYAYASELCLKHGVEGVRADVLLVKAGRAYAALGNRKTLELADIDAVAPFVLRYRSKTPPPPSGHTPETSKHNGGGRQEQQAASGSGQATPQSLKAEAATQGVKLFRKQVSRATNAGKVAPIPEARVARPVGRAAPRQIDLLKSVVKYTLSGKFEVIHKAKQGQGTVWVIFLIDSSASMVREQQIQYCKGIIDYTLRVYAGKRVCFAGVGLLQGAAEVVHAGTTDVHAFAERLADFQSGGRTNLTAGFQQVSMLLRQNHRARQEQKQLYIFTDGRINAAMVDAADPVQEAVDYYHRYLKSISYTQVLNTERGFVKLDKAQALADQLRVSYANVA